MAEVGETVLERAIAAVQRGSLEFQTMVWTFAASDLLVASAEPPAGDELQQIAPLVVQSEGLSFLAVFTTPARAEDFAPEYRYLAVRNGLELLRALPDDAGVVVNPGSTVGFEMRADGVARLRDEILG